MSNPEFPEKPVVIVLIANRELVVRRDIDIKALDKRGVTAARVMGLAKTEEF